MYLNSVKSNSSVSADSWTLTWDVFKFYNGLIMFFGSKVEL